MKKPTAKTVEEVNIYLEGLTLGIADSGAQGPSGVQAPVGSTYRQTAANPSHGNLAGLLWNKVGTGTTEGTDWLVDYEGRWVSYTPTIGGWTKGSGTATGQYCQIGKKVTVRCQLLLSSTTVASGLTFSLPAAAVSGILTPAAVLLNDVSDTVYTAVGWVSASSLSVYSLGSSVGRLASFSSTAPFTWANNDLVYATATYEIA